MVYVGTSSAGGLQSTFDDDTSLTTAQSANTPMQNEPVDPPPAAPVPTSAVTPADDAFLVDQQKKEFQNYWDHSETKTGLTLDRTQTDGTPPPPGASHHKVASIASTGFALSGYCIAADRGWIPAADAKERTRNTLDFFANWQE